MKKIILIGGIPRNGKTTLAKKISERLNVSTISTDTLEYIAYQYIPEDKIDNFFPKNLLRRKTDYNNDRMYSEFSAEEISESYIKQSDTVSKAIKALVEHSSQVGIGFVIEGYHLTPKLIKELKENKEYGKYIESIILINTNPEEIVERSISSDTEKDWLRDQTEDENTYEKVGSMLNLYSNKLKQESEKEDIEVIDTGNDFQQKIIEAFEYLIKQP